MLILKHNYFAKYGEVKLGDYLHLSELPQVEKIWGLMKTKDRDNIKLAQQLAKEHKT